MTLRAVNEAYEESASPGRPQGIGVAGVTVEGALVCMRTLFEESERRLAAGCRPEVAFHQHPFSAYYPALAGGDWATVTALLVDSIDKLRQAGADFAIIPCNVVHFAIGDIAARAPIPVLDLVAETAAESERRGYARVGVLGTRWTMEGGLYDAPLRQRGIEPVVPGAAEQQTLQSIIVEELVAGRVREESTARLLAVVESLKAQGCQAMVLACTELPLALTEQNCGVALIDTTRLLAERAVAHAARPRVASTLAG